MKTFMQEYGRTMLVAIIGSISLGICYMYLTGTVFRVQEDTTEPVPITSGSKPVIVAPQIIRIDVGDTKYDASLYLSAAEEEGYQEVYRNYLALVHAYENSAEETVCSNVSVAGIEQINVSRPGRYQLIYRAENRMGSSFSKSVEVIVR